MTAESGNWGRRGPGTPSEPAAPGAPRGRPGRRGRLARSPLRSTWARLTALSVAVLAASLVSTVVIAWELALLQGRDNLDRELQRELDVFAATAPALLAGTGADDTEEIAERARGFLATQPGTDRTFTTIAVTGRRSVTTAAGPAAIVTLQNQGRLPDGVPNRLVTVDTAVGPVRVLATPIELDGATVGTFTVYGWREGVEADAALVAQWTGVAAAIVGVLGVVALTVAFRSATRPLRALHDTAERAGLADLTVRVPDPGDTNDDVADLSRAFNRMLARLEAETSARTALFASVSHELRTPVAVVRGHLELLTLGAAKDPEESLRLVADELTRLSRLLDDLLLLSAAGAARGGKNGSGGGGPGGGDAGSGIGGVSGGGGFLAPRPGELGWLASEVELRLAGLGLADVPVEVAAGDDASAQLRFDPDRLIQAVVNLAVNARRHTPPGTPVRVTVAGDERELVVTVADQGPGIPEELRERVLEPFVGGGGRGSTGLGLAVVAAVVQAHGGQVDLDTGDAGTAVTIRIPDQEGGAGEPR